MGFKINSTPVEYFRYRPQGLLPSKGFEVRISAPATVSFYFIINKCSNSDFPRNCFKYPFPLQIPASIHLWLEPAGSPLQDTPRRQSRKLLNAEKIMFRTGSNGGILYQGKEVGS
jgi:hypothetical protein